MADINTNLDNNTNTVDTNCDIAADLRDEGVSKHPPHSPKNGDEAPLCKAIKKDELAEASDANLYQDLSQTSVETNISIIEKLTELQEENMKLKRQYEELSSKACKCNLNLSSSNDDVTDAKESNSLITIRFHDKRVAEEYSHKLVKFFNTFVEFRCLEDDLSIDIVRSKDEDVDLTSDDKSPSKKRKRKKSKSKSKDLFVLDTTPSLNRADNTLKYTSKYLMTVETESSPEKDNAKCPPVSVCFNCEQNHSLRDCTLPKNFVKINAARNKLKQQHQQTKTRYHTDEDQKYSHLKPGEISAELKTALGIYPNELPSYIYRMRICGYPPGWMEDAWVTHSNISLYGMDGKELSRKNNNKMIDPAKVVEYPGFNVPLQHGVKDEYEHYSCPPYSEKYNKSTMLEYISKKILNEQDNLEACDMDLDQSSDEVLIPAGCEPKPADVVEPVVRLSPSLVDLEQKKLELLAELGDNTTNSSLIEEKTDCAEPAEAIDNESSEFTDSLDITSSYIVIDDAKEEETKCERLNGDDTKAAAEEVITPTAETVKHSTFGTPIVKGASPYNKLPNPANFSKDISPVINFENLPNATGKYKQMNNILQKVRRTLKGSSENDL